MYLLSVENYKAMLNKLAVLAFFVGTACAVVLRIHVDQIDSALGDLDLTVPLGIAEPFDLDNVPFGTLVFGVAAAFISHAFKLHDKLAALFGIRRNFDVKRILKPMADLSSVVLDDEKLQRMKSQRSRLMRDVFYRYASSSEGRQVIDPHIITQALTNWSWYWFCLEAVAFLILTSIALIGFGEWSVAIWLIVVISALIVAMKVFMRDSIENANSQVQEILSDPARKAEIKARLDAV
jgi:cytochrome c oxidase subunit IV